MKKNETLTSIATKIDPVPGDAFQDLAHSDEGRATLEAILEAPPADRTGGLRRAPVRPRWARNAAAVAVAAALVAGVVAVTAPEPEEQRPATKWAAALVRMAEGSPRLLLDAEGWRVTGAEEFEGDTGEMYFENGRSCHLADAPEGCYWMSLNWYPAEMYRQYLASRRRDADGTRVVTVADHEADLFRHDGTALGTTIYVLWTDGRHSMELRSDVIPTVDAFVEVAETLHAVDVDTWLSALPQSLVKPDERREAVDRVLADVPVPSNVDVEALRSAPRVNASVDDEVVGAVVCGWVQQWIDARRSGDEATEREAVEALAGAREWKVFGGLGGGGYVVDVADAMAVGAPITPGSSVPVGTQYLQLLGCPED